jgi:intracellular sulfur oxidation DsrE/DsrF family protein
MKQVDRRLILAGLALSAGTGLARAEPKVLSVKDLEKDTDVACVYHCDFGDPQRLGQMATNVSNHLSVYDYDPFKAKIVIVAHGAGIKPFLVDLAGTPWAAEKLDQTLYERFQGLAKHGVEILLCQITFKRNKIDLAKARSEPFIHFVPSGVATVAELQAKGFAYVKVG